MLRMTWLLVIEALVFATLASLLISKPYDANTTQTIGYVLAAVALFVVVMAVGQSKLLRPFAKRVGICELCTK